MWRVRCYCLNEVLMAVIFKAAPRLNALRSREPIGQKTIGGAIRSYAFELAEDKTTTFAQNIDNFIACTKESKEVVPQVRNVLFYQSYKTQTRNLHKKTKTEHLY